MKYDSISEFKDINSRGDLSTDLAEISEDTFFCDYIKCKRMVDAGLSHHFVLLNSSSISKTTRIRGTKLSDIEDIFGRDVLSTFHFSFYPGDDSVDDPEDVQSLWIRRLTNTDKRHLRANYKFFPQNSYVCEWADATGCVLMMPFVQSESGEIKWLIHSGAVRGSIGRKRSSNFFATETMPGLLLEEIIDILPDILDCNLASVRYNGVDMVIPVSKKTAKRTFKNRDKEDGVKKRLIHTVKTHGRKNLVNTTAVNAHVRGTSNFTIKGVEVRLFATLDQAAKIIKSERKRR